MTVNIGDRRFWTTDGHLDLPYAEAGGSTEQRREVESVEQAELIGSLTHAKDTHLPLFDLDFDAQLLPSKTPSHYHLYANKPIAWRKYKRVPRVMWKAGLIERGYYRLAVKRGQAFVRVPA